MQKEQRFIQIVSKFIGVVGQYLPDDVLSKLSELKEKETGKMARVIYDCMFDNLEKADRLARPICQDTGVLQFFLRVGTRFPLIDSLEELLIAASADSTEKTPLRHNAVEPFDEKNTGTNIGTKAPWIEYELVPNSSTLEMDVYMAGGGCSLPGRAQVFMPSAGYEGIVEYVANTVSTLGVNACPPLVVGVGIGTCVSSAAKLSKKAAMRRLGTSNPHPLAADMERELEKALNSIGIGPQGLSGDNSVLGVNIEYAARHPSTLAAGISVGCWAHRRGTIRIDEDINYTLLSHKEREL
ncbi:MAG: L(+)-tartrate dehydratase subunit alpha [Clostridia bacterium]